MTGPCSPNDEDFYDDEDWEFEYDPWDDDDDDWEDDEED